MTAGPEYSGPDAFLARVSAEAAAWSLRPLPLPGGLVLLQENLSGTERRRFLLMLNNRLGPAPIGGEAPLDQAAERLLLSATAAGCSGGGRCQVTVEERRQLFNCF